MEKFLSKLEYRYRWTGIQNLMIYLCGTMVIIFLAQFISPSLPLYQYMFLFRDLVLRGQVWRVITFVFLPSSTSLLSFLLTTYCYFLVGTTLEQHWGSFRLTVYYLCGVVGAIIAGMIGGYGTTIFLNLSLFMVFATLFPEVRMLLFFIIPIKAKYIAYIDLLFFAYYFITGDWSSRLAIIFALLNYFLFLGPRFFRQIKSDLASLRIRSSWNKKNNPPRGPWNQ
jgi:hypothetical protein